MYICTYWGIELQGQGWQCGGQVQAVCNNVLRCGAQERQQLYSRFDLLENHDKTII